MIFTSNQIKSFKSIYFDLHRYYTNYRFQNFYSIIYETSSGMHIFEGLFTLREILDEKHRIRTTNPHCKIYLENEQERCLCSIQ